GARVRQGAPRVRVVVRAARPVPLQHVPALAVQAAARVRVLAIVAGERLERVVWDSIRQHREVEEPEKRVAADQVVVQEAEGAVGRSEERRVGKEGRSGGWPEE